MRRGEQPAHCFSSHLKLSSSGDVSLVRCTYDTVAVLSNPALFEACEQFAIPRWFLLFQGQKGEVRIMAISSALGHALKSLQNGVPLEDIARSIEDRAQREAFRTTMEGLLTSGVPFVSNPTSVKPGHSITKQETYER